MNNSHYFRNDCRLCHSKNLSLALSLENSPLCDAYVQENKKHLHQDTFPLELYLCLDCGFLQIECVVNPEIIYRDYIYVTSSSLGLNDHFNKYASDVISRLNIPENSYVLDVGSNDGMLLKCFKKLKMKVLGIEPAIETAEKATERGIESISDFFGPKIAKNIFKEYGAMDVITINNLLANVDNLDELAESVEYLLSPNGFLIIESSYLGDMINNMVFDFIYHEHLSYLSIIPLVKYFKKFGLELMDLQKVPTKGGSMRYYFQNKNDSKSVKPHVVEWINDEIVNGLHDIERYKKYEIQIEKTKTECLEVLQKLVDSKASIIGYGASATSTTLIHHYGLQNILDYLVDDNPAKIGTYSPGLHLPVKAPFVLNNLNPTAVLILAWRFTDTIVNKHLSYLKGGGTFIRPLPNLKIFDKSG